MAAYYRVATRTGWMEPSKKYLLRLTKHIVKIIKKFTWCSLCRMGLNSPYSVSSCVLVTARIRKQFFVSRSLIAYVWVLDPNLRKFSDASFTSITLSLLQLIGGISIYLSPLLYVTQGVRSEECSYNTWYKYHWVKRRMKSLCCRLQSVKILVTS